MFLLEVFQQERFLNFFSWSDTRLENFRKVRTEVRLDLAISDFVSFIFTKDLCADHGTMPSFKNKDYYS